MLDPVGSFSMQMPDPVKKKLFVQSPPSTLLTTKRKQDVRSHSTAQDRKKLFVGMAPKSAYEEDYRSVFTPFGSITDIYVIRDRNGFSKGCAFVKYELVKDARNAIEALHDKYIMPGGFRTLVVSVADERRSPQASTGHEMGGGSGECVRAPAQSLFLMDGDGGGHGDGTARMRERMAPDSHVSCVGGPQAAARALSAATASIPVLPDMQQLFCGGNPPQGTYVFYPHVPPSSSTTASRSQYLKHAEDMDAGGSFSPQIFTVGLSGRVECHNQCNAQSTTATNVSLAAGVVAAQSKHVQDYENELREDEHGAGGGGGLAARDLGVIGPDEKSRRWAKQAVGPTGANLFVYYLPGSLSDADLATAFAPFGELLSAKVYYDRDTGESKGFGFVSYARPQHAEAAIGRMNGFFVGNKRLKVVRKRGQQLDRCCSDNSTGNKTCSTSPSPRRPTSSSYCTPVGASLRTMIRRGDEKKVNGKADTELTGRRADSGDVTDEQGEPFCDSLRLNLDFLAHDGVHGQSSRRFT